MSQWQPIISLLFLGAIVVNCTMLGVAISRMRGRKS
jgi:hypothetical protein